LREAGRNGRIEENEDEDEDEEKKNSRGLRVKDDEGGRGNGDVEETAERRYAFKDKNTHAHNKSTL